MKTVSHLAELRNETNHKPLSQMKRRAEPSRAEPSRAEPSRAELLAFKSRLHDASWLARVKSRGCGRRRFMQHMESSTGWTSKRVASSIVRLAWNVCAHPRDLTHTSRLASCKRSFTDGCIMSARSDHFSKFDGCKMSPDESHQQLQTCTEGLIISILYFNILLDLIKYTRNSISQTIIQL
jgi:hypothetical protein